MDQIIALLFGGSLERVREEMMITITLFVLVVALQIFFTITND